MEPFQSDTANDAVLLARQAWQITASVPGSLARACSWALTEVLAEAGDLASARRVCAAGLAQSRNAADLHNLASLLVRMAVLDVRAGSPHQAAAHLHEALQIAVRTGARLEVMNAVDCCANLCAATGRHAEAITLWAAQAACYQHEGLADQPLEMQRRAPYARQARQVLGPEQARVAEGRGAAMSLDTAAQYALMLTVLSPPHPAKPGKLSAREQELVTLVAQGRTDAQIAAQLYISIRTVRSHLDRIRDKTGCRRRADLTRLALQADLV